MAEGYSLTQSFFSRVVLKHPWVVILCILAVVGFLSFKARDFRLDASAETLILENDEDLKYSRMISSRYGQQDFLVITYTPKDDLFSEKNLSLLSRLQEELVSLEAVSSALCLLDVPLLESPPVSLKELTAELPTLRSPGVDMDLARIELRQSPLYENLLLSPNSQTTTLFINFPKNVVYHDLIENRDRLRQKKASGSLTKQENDELKRLVKDLRQHRYEKRLQRHQDIFAIKGVIEKYRRDADIFIGGISMFADNMITYIKSDLKVFGSGALFFLIIMLGMIFRRKRWIFLSILCCIVSIICMVGLLGWFGWEVTVISSNFISLQLILTLAIVIHLIVRYREMLLQNPDASNHQLILDTIQLKIKPCAYAVLTTIAGFSSLVLSNILPVRTFGWMMIAGLVVSMIVTFLLFPVVLILIPKETPSTGGRWHLHLTEFLARFTQKHGMLIIGVSGVILVGSIIGITKLKVENSFIGYFKESTEVHQGMKVIDQYLGGTTPLDVIINFETKALPADTEPAAEATDDIFDEFDEFDDDIAKEKYWFTSEKMNLIKAAHKYIDELPETGKVLSLATILSVAEKLKGGKPLESFELALLYSEIPEKFKALLISPYVSVEHNQARFWVRVRDSDKSLRRDEFLKKIRTELPIVTEIDSERIHLAGLLVLYNNMLQSLFSSQILTLGVTLLVLMGMFLILFRSFKVALIALLPNLLPIAVVLGVMGWLGIPLDMMTMTIAAIGIGIAVDNTIHYIHRFKYEFQKDRKYIPAMHRCHGSIGHAMYYTSATIIIGFSILALSNFVPSIYFGLLTSLAMFIAFLVALTLLPQMLILIKPFGKES